MLPVKVRRAWCPEPVAREVLPEVMVGGFLAMAAKGKAPAAVIQAVTMVEWEVEAALVQLVWQALEAQMEPVAQFTVLRPCCPSSVVQAGGAAQGMISGAGVLAVAVEVP